MIKVLIVDDDELMRAGLRMIIDQTPDISVVAEVGDGSAAIRETKLHRPDVVLMDVRMPTMDGIEATRRITADTDSTRVMMLTTFELDEYVFEALRAGASGFLLKRSPPETLIEGIRAVAAGESLLAPSVTRRLIEEFSSERPRRDARLIGDLTTREREVLMEMARGRNNEEIAGNLFISENTVKTHVKHVLTKIGARDRTQAVVIAFDSGLMD